MFNVSSKLTHLNRDLWYTYPVFKHILFIALYINIQYICLMPELGQASKYFLLC